MIPQGLKSKLLTIFLMLWQVISLAQNRHNILEYTSGKLEVFVMASDSLKMSESKSNIFDVEIIRDAQINLYVILNIDKMYVKNKRNPNFKPKIKLLASIQSQENEHFYVDYELPYFLEVKHPDYQNWNMTLMAFIPPGKDSLGNRFTKPKAYGIRAKMLKRKHASDTLDLAERIAFYNRTEKRFTVKEKKVTINERKPSENDFTRRKREKEERELNARLSESNEDKERGFDVMFDGSSFELVNGDTLNIIDLNNYKQGPWVHYGAESDDPAYPPGSPWYQGTYKNNLRTNDWTKFYPTEDTAAVFNLDKDTLSGKFKFFHENGLLHEEGQWDLELNGLVGTYKEYYEEGGLFKEFQYDKENKRQGKQMVYYTNGNYAIISNMHNDILHGYTNYYLEDGQIYLQQLYKEGKLINEKYFGDKNKFPARLKQAFKDVMAKRDSSVEKKVYAVIADLSRIDSNYSLLLAQRDRELREKDLLLSEKEKENLIIKNKLSQADMLMELQKTELSRQRALMYGISFALALMIVLVVLVFRNNQQRKKTNELLRAQKELVEDQHMEIQASINYAKRIQNAILPPTSLVKKHLKNSFIYYRPKDIVAGDFYWFEVIDQDIFIAAADCTGHGVPGAMVSVVCANAMNRAVNELNLKEPAKILDKVRELVVETFEKSEEDVKDGMDISLCKINTLTNILSFSGAHNPLYRVTPMNGEVHKNVLKNNTHQLIEYKGDKQPIGKFDFQKPFTQKVIQLKKGDYIYLSSDGYPDQFGGDKGRKFMYKPFKKLFLDLHQKDMDVQKSELIKSFDAWMGNHEQVDDVCVIGVKV